MLSRVFGRGSVYETLDLDDHPPYHDSDRDPPSLLYQRSALHQDDTDPIDSRHEAFPLSNRAGYSAGTRGTSSRPHHHHISGSLYPHYENTLPDLNEEEGNDDVPGSLLVEEQPHQHRQDATTTEQEAFYEPFDPAGEQDLDNLERGGLTSPPRRGGARTPDPTMWLGLVDPKERALWKWANVENLDVFLQQVQTPRNTLEMFCLFQGLWLLYWQRHLLYRACPIFEFSVTCRSPKMLIIGPSHLLLVFRRF